MHAETNAQKASSILKKHNTIKFIVFALAFLAYVATDILIKNTTYAILSFVIYTLFMIAFSRILFYKMIYRTLLDQLDAPLYNEIVKQGKIYVPSTIFQMQAEYYLGNYGNVIAICHRKLATKQVAKKYKYYYMTFLANCYFDTGDEEKLRDVCDAFYQSVAKEKRGERFIKRYSVFEFIQSYLTRNFDACNQYIQKRRSSIKLIKTATDFKKAYIALANGEKDAAKIQFRAIVKKAPFLNYAMLSEKALQSIEEGYEYKRAFEELTENEDFVIPDSTRTNKKFRKAFVIAAVVVLVLWMLFSINSYIINSKADKDAYFQKVEALVETDYDGVDVLDCFHPEQDGEVVDSMFICRTSTSILVGCTYVYSGDETWYYDVLAEESYDFFLQDADDRRLVTYNTTTTDHYVVSAFYKNKADIPKKCYYSIPFTVGEREFYYAITYIEDGKREDPSFVGSPIHFDGIDETTRKKDVRNLYGSPAKIFEEQNSEQ